LRWSVVGLIVAPERWMAMADEVNFAVDGRSDLEMDSLRVLPLNIIPLETASLKRARMVKNVRLDSVVELFYDQDTGSGQVNPMDLGKMFDWDPKNPPPDDALINALANLASYDVYTLRIQLRKLGINVDENVWLKLSKSKSAELTQYMTKFTMPLIQQIFGDTHSEIENIHQLIGMFSSPDKSEALKNLRMMATKLNINLADVPAFLEEYGDVFLSLAYFRDSLDQIVPMTIQFNDAMDELNQSYQMRSDRRLSKSVEFVREELQDITASITGRFESFDRNSQKMWDNISASSFAAVKRMIQSHHVTVGGVLCGLSVKMDKWDERFSGGRGGVVKLAEFIKSDMTPGMERISIIEKSAPKIALI
jgi:hypothetical protein